MKKAIIGSLTAIFLIAILLGSVIETSAGGIGVDVKTSRTTIKINKNLESVDAGVLTGTITNYGPDNYTNIIVEVTIVTDAAFPVEAKGGSENIQLFATKVWYKIANLTVEETVDWVVRLSVTDSAIKEIRYDLTVYQNKNGTLERLYVQVDTKIPVEVQTVDGPENYKNPYVNYTKQSSNEQPKGFLFGLDMMTTLAVISTTAIVLALILGILKVRSKKKGDH